MAWDPLSRGAWSKALGVIPVPMFGAAHPAKPAGVHDVLLDGQAASFALLIGDDPGLLLGGDEPLAWTWSSYLRRALFINSQTHELFLRTWGENGDRRRLKLPRSANDAEQLFKDEIESAPRPRAEDVVTKILLAFKTIRAGLVSYGARDEDIIRAFNLLLSTVEANNDWERCQSIGDLAKAHESPLNSLEQFSRVSVEDAIYVLANANPAGVPRWDVNLFVRHSIGFLYQEAHFELERHAAFQMSLFGGRAPSTETRGKQQRDARFTPPALARSLVEQAIRHLPEGATELHVLDPACGCGVFLLEVLRELEARNYKGHVRLVGLDASKIATIIAEFCVGRAAKNAQDTGMRVTLEIRHRNALNEDWEHPDLILMNPPFTSYVDMSSADREATKRVLQSVGFGNFDKSMAFMFKAAEALSQGGALGSVMPSPLFDTSSGEGWRSAMMHLVTIRLLGRFHGYRFFPGALVEPGFIVATKRASDAKSGELTVLVANEGSESAALRVLRKGRRQSTTEVEGCHVNFDYSSDVVQANGWMPRTFEHEKLLAALTDVPRVQDLFDVRQGAHAGANDVFFVTDVELERLPPREHQFFRPAAGTKTIRDGRLFREEYVFYPYDESGLVLRTVDDLQSMVPTFYQLRLRPQQDRLATRPSMVQQGVEEWWSLKRERPWQHRRVRKILTAYFGGAGHFAYDETGDFVSVQGYAWFPVTSTVPIVGEEPEDAEFFDTDLPWAYTAILNSQPFAVLLSCFCSRVQGGQYNLSKRFVNNVPLPNLTLEDAPDDLSAELAQEAKEFASGAGIDHERLSHLAARAYGVPLSDWRLDAEL